MPHGAVRAHRVEPRGRAADGADVLQEVLVGRETVLLQVVGDRVRPEPDAVAPVAGIFSPDNTLFFAGTTGDNLLHVINTSTLQDTQQINPKLTDINGNPLPPVFLAVKPRPTT